MRYPKLTLSALLAILVGLPGQAQRSELQDAPTLTNAEYTVAQRSSRRRRARGNSDFVEALKLAKAGKYQEASARLFQLSHSPRYRSRRMQIKYILGLMLYQMNLNQVAAFQFISVVRDGNNRFLKDAIEKLSLAADKLDDDTLLKYAISKVKVDEFPRVHRDMLYFRIGELQQNIGQHASAAASLNRVSRQSPLYPKAKYMQGLSLAESNRTKPAIKAFDQLLDSRYDKPVTDPYRVAGLMGKARVFYQMKDWDNAVENYRDIPRDTGEWHDTMFEASWAMLRSGRFRSALSNFQTLHSAYYEDTYLPESLLLRSIVYLYICKYDEMEKVLNLFTRVYKPVYDQVGEYLSAVKDPVTYFNDVIKVMSDYNAGVDVHNRKYAIPYIVVQKLTHEGDFNRSYQYIKNLLEERRQIKSMPASWRQSAIGKYSAKVVHTRLLKARKKAGRQIQTHLRAIKTDLFDLFEQEGFIRYEMINGRKETLKKEVAGKDLPTEQINDDTERDYYVQNGFEYWPFQGEYWLDELGNYHYVGTQSCK